MLPGSCAGVLMGRACVADGVLDAGRMAFAAAARAGVLDLGGVLGGVLGGALDGVLACVGARGAAVLAGTTGGAAFAGFAFAAALAWERLSGRDVLLCLSWRACWGCGSATCSGTAALPGLFATGVAAAGIEAGAAGFAGDAECPIGRVPWLGACRGAATFGTLRVFAAMSTAEART